MKKLMNRAAYLGVLTSLAFGSPSVQTFAAILGWMAVVCVALALTLAGDQVTRGHSPTALSGLCLAVTVAAVLYSGRPVLAAAYLLVMVAAVFAHAQDNEVTE